jgi:Family of unknown function (DUF6011)
MTTTATTTIATPTQRPTRFNPELFRKETYCHSHWWHGDTCLYGAHSLVEEETAQATPHADEQQAIAEAEAIVQQAQAPTSIHDGFYTIVMDGDHKHRTFRLRTQADDEHFAPGRQILGFLAGSDNESDYVNFAFIVDGEIKLWSRFRHGYDNVIASARYLISGDHQAAGRAYARESKNCYICNRLLTTVESIAAGIGPTCASRL